MSSSIAEQVALWREKLNDASARWGEVEICAVTKTVDVDTINQAWDAGIRVIGENRVQELSGKLDKLNKGFDIHLIGHLQSNKVKNIIGHVSTVQSLDSVELARIISRRSVEQGIVTKALLQVNIGNEPQKSGVKEEQILALLREIATFPGIAVNGLMAIMPFVDNPEDVRPLFKRMRAWFDRLRDEPIEGIEMKTLSMGMSDDCLVAAQEGATMVRLGRALFGARPPMHQ